MLEDRRAVTVRTEHLFGPYHALAHITEDVAMVEDFLKIAPAEHKLRMRHLTARVIELHGWTAQESGKTTEAATFTHRAATYAKASGDNAYMPWSPCAYPISGPSQTTTWRPFWSRKPPRSPRVNQTLGYTRSSLANQHSLRPRAGTVPPLANHAAHARDYANAKPHPLVGYVDDSYIDSELAAAHLLVGKPEHALDLLGDKVIDRWSREQERDHAVAAARRLHTPCLLGDYATTLDEYDDALSAYRVAPSARARNALRGAVNAHPITQPTPVARPRAIALSRAITDTLEGATPHR